MTHEALNGLRRYLVTVGGALTVALVVQAISLVYWAGRVNATLDTLSNRVDVIDTRVFDMMTSPARPPAPTPDRARTSGV